MFMGDSGHTGFTPQTVSTPLRKTCFCWAAGAAATRASAKHTARNKRAMKTSTKAERPDHCRTEPATFGPRATARLT